MFLFNKKENTDTEKKLSSDSSISTSNAESFFNNSNIKKQICLFDMKNDDLNYIKTQSLLNSKDLKFIRTFFISIVPRFLKFADFLKPLYDFSNTRTSIFITPIKSGETQSNLNDIISSNHKAMLMAQENKDFNKVETSEKKIKEAESLRDEINSNFNRLFDISILSTVEANELHNLNVISESLGLSLSKSMINIRSCWGTQQSACKSNMPFNENLLESRSNIFDIFGAGCIFPFISDTITHPQGIIFGTDKITNKIIFLDTFYNLLLNKNILLIGSKNSKKYNTINLLTLRSSTCLNLRTIAIDTNYNFTNICDTLLGTNISLSASSKIIINPFDIEPEVINDEITGRAKTFIDLNEKIEEVTTLILNITKSMSSLDFADKTTYDIIKNIITEEYNSIKITNNPNSLYNSEKTELINNQITKQKKVFPTLGSWFRRLCLKKSKNENPELLNHYNYLIKYTKDFIKELNGKYLYFDGQTNIKIDPDVKFINFDLSQIEKNVILPISQQILLNWITENFVKPTSATDKEFKQRLILDDCSNIFKYCDASQNLNNTFNRCVNKKISFTIISNEYLPFEINKKILNTLNSCSIKLIMNTDSTEVDALKSQLKLTEGETEFIKKCGPNEGILSAGNDSCQFQLLPVGYEEQLI